MLTFYRSDRERTFYVLMMLSMVAASGFVSRSDVRRTICYLAFCGIYGFIMIVITILAQISIEIDG